MRDKYIDSVKGVLIVLVVVGHLLEPYMHILSVAEVYKFIYSFHMPAFIFIAGTFSSRKTDECVKSALRLLRLLLIFTVIYEGLHYIQSGGVSQYARSLSPYWLLWFLLSLAFWRALTPLILKLKWPTVSSLLFSVVGLWLLEIGYPLSLARTLTFLPFYVAGLAYGQQALTRLRAADMKKAIGAGILGVAFAFIASQWIDLPMLYGSQAFMAATTDVFIWASDRLYAYLISAIAVAAIFALTIRTKALAYFGSKSLHIYLWHGLLIKAWGL